jgi:hypothetical protein
MPDAIHCTRRGVIRKVLRELQHKAIPALRRAIAAARSEPNGRLLRMHLHQELCQLDDIAAKLKRDQSMTGGQAR